ncbi:MAG TPA: histidine kinase [Actinoplanes sp.]|jgi:signal transduction histidine kinase|nr:histidine kinase [Actinoplanes sp.]
MASDGRLVPRIAAAWQGLTAWARGVPPLVVDAVLVIACYLTIVIDAALDGRLEWWVVVLAATNTVPLLWRRRYPLLVTAIVGIGTAWLDLAYQLIEIPAAQLVATYTFAALSPPLGRMIGVLGTVIGVTASITVPGDKLLNLAPNALMFLVAYTLGTSARARRARIEMLEERARRLAEEQEAAAARERQRIAREMHDILAHSMSLVVVQAEAGPVAVHSDPDKAEEVFDTISATAREALAQLRRTLTVLREDQPDRQPQPGLDGLAPLVDGVRRAGLAASLEEHGERRPVPADLAATAYRIVQESLTNTVKHAAARQVSVRLEWLGGALKVEVRDDGRGPAGSRGPGGRGLLGMRERVSAAGGELTCGPGPDGVGFRVAASLPLQ